MPKLVEAARRISNLDGAVGFQDHLRPLTCPPPLKCRRRLWKGAVLRLSLVGIAGEPSFQYAG
jgi:hypothetical protein